MKANLKDYNIAVVKLIAARYPEELKMGIKVEMEHTDSPKVARQIAIGHILEDKHYYKKLKDAGLADELAKSMDPELRHKALALMDDYSLLKQLDGFPSGVDLENCDVIRITNSIIYFAAGGDWQQSVNIGVGIKDGKLAVVSLYEAITPQKKSELHFLKKEICEDVVAMEKARKDYTDKLGRTWHWNDTTKKYDYVRKGTKVAASATSKPSTSPTLPAPMEQRPVKKIEDVKMNSWQRGLINLSALPNESFYTNITSDPEVAKKYCLDNFKVKLVGQINHKNHFLWSNVIYQLDVLKALGYINSNPVKVSMRKQGAGKEVGKQTTASQGVTSTVQGMYDSRARTIYIGSEYRQSFIHEYVHHLDYTKLQHQPQDRAAFVNKILDSPEIMARFRKASERYVDKNYLTRDVEVIARFGESAVYSELVRMPTKSLNNSYLDILMGDYSRKMSGLNADKYFTMQECDLLRGSFKKLIPPKRVKRQDNHPISSPQGDEVESEKQTPLRAQMQLLYNIRKHPAMLLSDFPLGSYEAIIKPLVDLKYVTIFGKEQQLQLTAKGKTKLDAYLQLGGELSKSWKLQGHTNFQGLDIAIENKRGTYRRGTDPDGHEWETYMGADYGYIRFTEGPDGDAVDCYIGPHKDSGKVFVIHQLNPYAGGMFDEDKVMLGFNSASEAKRLYRKQYDRSDFFGSMEEWCIHDFISHIHTKKKFMTLI